MSRSQSFSLIVQVEARTAFLTQGPGGAPHTADRTIEVCHGESGRPVPFIPGSSLKGRTRSHVERLCRTLGQPVCRPPDPAWMCPHGNAVPAGTFCIPCRIFGSPWRESGVRFSDLVWQGSAPDPETRSSVSISRRTGSAHEALLRTVDVAPRGRLSGRIEGRLTLEELKWLVAGLRLVRHLGSGKARGLGAVRLTLSGDLPEGLEVGA